MATIVCLLLLGVPLGCAVLQVRPVARWHGGFRLAAMLPILGWLAWIAKFAPDVVFDPTSQNLFPFEILLNASAALLYLGFLSGFRMLIL